MSIDATLEEPKHWGLVGTILWGALVAAIFVFVQVAGMLASISLGNPNLSPEELQALVEGAETNGSALSIATIATATVCVPLLLGIVKLKRGSRIASYLAVRLPPLKVLATWFGVLALFIALTEVVSVLMDRPAVPEFMASVYASTEPVWLLWVALAVAAPLFEEVFFRGFLLKGLSFMGPVAAIGITAALWAAVHLQYDRYDVSVIFLLGLLLGTARVKTDSLLVPIVLHAAINLLATVETAFVLGHAGA